MDPPRIEVSSVDERRAMYLGACREAKKERSFLCIFTGSAKEAFFVCGSPTPRSAKWDAKR